MLKRGLAAQYHLYEKNTGKGFFLIVRSAHSVQTSGRLNAWKKTFANFARDGKISKAAHDECIEEAKDKPWMTTRYIVDTGGKKETIVRCKEQYLRSYLAKKVEEAAEKFMKENPANTKEEIKPVSPSK